MKKFKYIALGSSGQQISGQLKAENEAEAIQQLRLQNLYPTQIIESKTLINPTLSVGKNNSEIAFKEKEINHTLPQETKDMFNKERFGYFILGCLASSFIWVGILFILFKTKG